MGQTTLAPIAEENESHRRNVEKGKKQKSIGQEATPDDELKIPADV